MVGVHLTPKVDGRVLIGPNAALSLSKEGYSFWDVNLKDTWNFALNKGLWKLVLKNYDVVLQEVWRDVNVKAFVGEAQRSVLLLKMICTCMCVWILHIYTPYLSTYLIHIYVDTGLPGIPIDPTGE